MLCAVNIKKNEWVDVLDTRTDTITRFTWDNFINELKDGVHVRGCSLECLEFETALPRIKGQEMSEFLNSLAESGSVLNSLTTENVANASTMQSLCNLGIIITEIETSAESKVSGYCIVQDLNSYTQFVNLVQAGILLTDVNLTSIAIEVLLLERQAGGISNNFVKIPVYLLLEHLDILPNSVEVRWGSLLRVVNLTTDSKSVYCDLTRELSSGDFLSHKMLFSEKFGDRTLWSWLSKPFSQGYVKLGLKKYR